ncbi:hypothetical protein [Salimicrobium halophilum]|uniref:Uncharacterized protein n=1 Tax=Salimicrobium halophilum TaxID=86666 RepID=A0A1G8RA29_9BACI|nr:hypothetical protein [Salimicrobium halophilum]SDJ13826.1 hypothetical protein SAMN04490247_0916 [Salimicrobium halophilum]
MLRKSSSISIIVAGVAFLLAALLATFYSSSRFPTFAIFGMTMVTSLGGIILGIIGLVKDDGRQAKLNSTLGILIGSSFVMLAIIFIAKGIRFVT